MDALDVLREAGCEVDATGPADLVLTLPDGTTLAVEVKTVSRGLRPSRVPAAPREHEGLLVAEWLSLAAVARAHELGWSVLTTTEAVLRTADRDIHLPISGADSPPAARVRPGRTPWGALAVRRLLLAAAEPLPQAELARGAGISQPRVSQTLAELSSSGLVARTGAGWETTDRAGLLEDWEARYPGPGGIATHWYGLDSVVAQAATAWKALATEGADPVVSGDVAADAAHPWRRPVRAVVYARRGLDLSDAGLVPAADSEATLDLVLPRDVSLWPQHPRRAVVAATSVHLADPLQVLYDLRHSPGADATEAADQWRAHLLAHLVPDPRT